MENQKYQDLIQKLLACVASCENCATSCLGEDNVKMMAGCIKLDRDCADMCALAARLLQRDSEIALQFLLLCEEICRKCAEECGRHEHEHCKQCAADCMACAEACHAHHQKIMQD